jgi:hypothetical protein
MRDFLPFLPWLGLLLSLFCLAGAFHAGRLRRLVENLPVSKTTGVFIGLVDVQGTAESTQPLTSYLAGEPCVHYDWNVQESWSRTVTETYTDSDGKTQTRTRHESGWTTVASGCELIPFYLRDDCGVILVRPEGAKLEPETLLDETCGRGDPLYYGKGPTGAIADSDHRRRFTERGIPHHASVCVIGQARERPDIVAAEIARDPRGPLFLVSTRSREQVSSGMKWGQWLWTFFGLVLAVGGLVWQDAGNHVPAETRLPVYAAAGLGFLTIAVFTWVWMVYNSLVDLRQRVRQAWSLVDVQLQRRHDLIPNLVEMVKGCRDYERHLQAELAALRGELSATPPGVAGPDYRAVTSAVAAIRERYPQITADANFMALQKNLVDTEQRIALARGYFNDIATHYNTRLEVVPERYVARLGAMQPQVLMAANEFERAAVKVDMVAPEVHPFPNAQ